MFADLWPLILLTSCLAGANLGMRRSPGHGANSSLAGDEHGIIRPDKLVLTRNGTVQSSPFVANSSSNSGAPGWAMIELFATTTLYHAVPTLPGHIIHCKYTTNPPVSCGLRVHFNSLLVTTDTANGSLFLDSPRKHWPHSAQGNQLVMYPKQRTSALAAKGKEVFPWYSAQQIVTPGGDWQLGSVPTRFLGAQSNDAKYTLHAINMSLIAMDPKTGTH